MIDHLDHLVLTVRDIPTTVKFYTDYLGMRAVTFGDGRVALRFGKSKINLHQAGAEFEPKAAMPTPGSADLCFMTRYDMDGILQMLEGLPIVEGPVRRTGAMGPIDSVYIRDPDGNLIELSMPA